MKQELNCFRFLGGNVLTRRCGNICVHLNEMRSLVRRVAVGVLSEYVRVLVFELRCSYGDFLHAFG